MAKAKAKKAKKAAKKAHAEKGESAPNRLCPGN